MLTEMNHLFASALSIHQCPSEISRKCDWALVETSQTRADAYSALHRSNLEGTRILIREHLRVTRPSVAEGLTKTISVNSQCDPPGFSLGRGVLSVTLRAWSDHSD